MTATAKAYISPPPTGWAPSAQLGTQTNSGTAAIDENCYRLPFGNTPQNNCVGPGAGAVEHHFGVGRARRRDGTVTLTEFTGSKTMLAQPDFSLRSNSCIRMNPHLE
jgi:hypothetical protein